MIIKQQYSSFIRCYYNTYQHLASFY